MPDKVDKIAESQKLAGEKRWDDAVAAALDGCRAARDLQAKKKAALNYSDIVKKRHEAAIAEMAAKAAAAKK
jgi:hypothetical protein